MSVNLRNIPIKPITPSGTLYILRVNAYIAKHGKEPTTHEKFEMYAKAEYDYNHATIPAKVTLDQMAKDMHKDMMKKVKK